MVRAVSSASILCCVTECPKNTSPCSSLEVIGPSFSDRPHLVTMLRAISVVRWMSFDAPVVTISGPKINSSVFRLFFLFVFVFLWCCLFLLLWLVFGRNMVFFCLLLC